MAVMEGGEPVVIPNSEGARTTPSIVAFARMANASWGKLLKGKLLLTKAIRFFSKKRLIRRKQSEIRNTDTLPTM